MTPVPIPLLPGEAEPILELQKRTSRSKATDRRCKRCVDFSVVGRVAKIAEKEIQETSKNSSLPPAKGFKVEVRREEQERGQKRARSSVEQAAIVRSVIIQTKSLKRTSKSVKVEEILE